MAHPQLTPNLSSLEDAITVLFCLVDDTYTLLNPGWRSYESLKRLSDSEVLTLALFQQLRGVESERSFLRDAQRFFAHLFPGIAGLHPSSLHRRVRKLRRFLESLRRTVLPELTGEPETLIVDSTLLEVLHPRQVSQSAGFDGATWVRWGSFALYGVKLHLLCSTNRVPLSYELSAANVADVLLVRELLAGADLDGNAVARRLLGDLAYRSGALGEELAECGVLLATEKAERRPPLRSRWRCASRSSSASSGWNVRWPRRSRAWPPGSRRRSPPTPTAATSIGCWVVLKAASRSFGPDILATLI
jgi:Transposase DDE domain